MSDSTATSAPVRIQPDSRAVVLTVTWLVGLLAVASFAAGVPGLLAVGRWAQLPDLMTWLVPVLLDGGLVVMALTATVRRARGESARFAFGWLAGLTAASMAGQVAHVLSEPSAVPWQAVAGALLAASFPALVFASTHSLLDLAVAPAPAKRAGRSGAAKATARRQTSLAAPASTVTRPALAVAESAPRRALSAVPTPATGTPAVAERDAQRAEAIRLREEGLSFGQIAQRLDGPSLSTVKRWCAAA